MRPTRSWQAPLPLWCFLLLAVAVPLSGCVQTAMLPAHRLESNETVTAISGSGILLVPQLGVQVTHGFGRGDVTANLGAAVGPESPIWGGGLAGRYYLPADLTVEAQLQATSIPVGDGSGRRAGRLGLLGIQTVPDDAGSWYYGAQVGVVSGPSPDLYFDERPPAGEVPTWTDPVVGGTVGYGPFGFGSSYRMQLELKANVPIWGAESEPPLPSSGLAVGIFGLFE